MDAPQASDFPQPLEPRSEVIDAGLIMVRLRRASLRWTSEDEARRSVAMTGSARAKFEMTSIGAAMRPDSWRQNRAQLLTCMKAGSRKWSRLISDALRTTIRAIVAACRSVGKAREGNGAVGTVRMIPADRCARADAGSWLTEIPSPPAATHVSAD